MNSNSKERRKERKFKKLTAELFLSGAMNEETFPSASQDFASDFALVKKQIRSLKRNREKRPKIHFNAERDFKKPVSVSELQNFLVCSVLHAQAPVKPKFCQIIPWRGISQTVAVVIDCDQITNTNLFEDEFQFFRRIPFVSGNFLHRFYSKFSDEEDQDFYQSFFQTPISLMDRLKFVQNSDESVKETIESEEIPNSQNASESKVLDSECISLETKWGKTNYLMTLSDMAEDNYPLPDRDQQDFSYSMTAYDKVTDDSPVYAVDCEMCMTGPNRQELTRISVVDEKLNIVLDTLVKPKNKIIDYVTRYSGITASMMRNVQTTLSDVQECLKRILPADAILCGHSLNFDLNSMHLFHPYSMDISVLYNLSGNRKSRTGLKSLAQTFLGEHIQKGKKGHCSVEDAYATMKLLLLKFTNGIQFGNVQMGWSYNEFAKANDIDRSTGLRTVMKRKLTDEGRFEESSSSKRIKLETEPKLCGWTCSQCGSTVEPNCPKLDCVCRRLPRIKCIKCLPSDPSVTQNGSIKISPESVFIVPSNGIEPIFNLFQRRKKKLLWAAIRGDLIDGVCNEMFCELAMKSKCCKHIHVPNNDECVNFFQSKFLENDFNVLELHYQNSNVEHIDTIVKDIMQYSGRNALICLIFKQKNKAVCCLKIKH